MLMPESLMCEGWVQKESRLLLEWRTRWLVLYGTMSVAAGAVHIRGTLHLAAMPSLPAH